MVDSKNVKIIKNPHDSRRRYRPFNKKLNSQFIVIR